VATQESFPTLREIVVEPPLFRTASLSDDILVHAMRYDLVGKSRRLFLPETLAAVARLTEVDRLNVCDSRDEVDHDPVLVAARRLPHRHGPHRRVPAPERSLSV
jgi:hypothetical protein